MSLGGPPRPTGRARAAVWRGCGLGTLALLVALVASCGGGFHLSDSNVRLELSGLDNRRIDHIGYTVWARDLEPIRGVLELVPHRVPPIWALISHIPPGTERHIRLRAYGPNGEIICRGEVTFALSHGEVKKIRVILVCGPSDDDDGSIEVDGDLVDGDHCPSLHSSVTIPRHIPEGGSSYVEVVASDRDHDDLSYAWMATSGHFDDPTAPFTHYHCDASGKQVLTVRVSDGNPDCDRTRRMRVTCGDSSDHEGSIEIDGTLNPANACPLIQSGVAIPTSLAVGSSAYVELIATDPDGDPLVYDWTATDGDFDDPTAQATHYYCTAPGPQRVTVRVSDGDPSCDKTESFDLTCQGEEPDGGVYDGGTETDGGVPHDGGVHDGGVHDGGVPHDGGVHDGGTPHDGDAS